MLVCLLSRCIVASSFCLSSLLVVFGAVTETATSCFSVSFSILMSCPFVWRDVLLFVLHAVMLLSLLSLNVIAVCRWESGFFLHADVGLVP